MSSDTDDNEESDVISKSFDADQFKKFEKKSGFHMIAAIIAIPLLMVMLTAGLINLGELHKTTVRLQKDKPESLVVKYSDRISSVKAKAEEQYKVYHDQLNSSSAFSDQNQMAELVSLTVKSDQDYLSFLKAYKELTYASASKVKGSGEWYFYYDKSLDGLVKKANSHLASSEK